MKNIALFILTIVSTIGYSQQIVQELEPFNKLIIDPYINVELVKGAKEKIEIYHSGVNANEINTRQRGQTLHVYLEDAKIGLRILKNDALKNEEYKYADVKMIITYTSLKSIQLRGEEKLLCSDELSGNKLKIKAYGETDIVLASVNSADLKVALFGDNTFVIGDGHTTNSKFNTYGENRLDTQNLHSSKVRTASFGENNLSVNVSDCLRIAHFGEGEISYSGNAVVEKKWLIGEVDFKKIK